MKKPDQSPKTSASAEEREIDKLRGLNMGVAAVALIAAAALFTSARYLDRMSLFVTIGAWTLIGSANAHAHFTGRIKFRRRPEIVRAQDPHAFYIAALRHLIGSTVVAAIFTGVILGIR